MAERIVQEESLLTVADAIREKTGGTEGLAFPEGFVEAINGISGGGGSTGSSDGMQYIAHAIGVIPEYEQGLAVSVRSMVGMFESSASGTLAS